MSSTENKKYQIKYQEGLNILLTIVEAPNTLSARYKFYMEHNRVDILDIKEIINEK